MPLDMLSDLKNSNHFHFKNLFHKDIVKIIGTQAPKWLHNTVLAPTIISLKKSFK